ncbi:MAG: AI-2E family transporter [Eubacteriales bacterium]
MEEKEQINTEREQTDESELEKLIKGDGKDRERGEDGEDGRDGKAGKKEKGGFRIETATCIKVGIAVFIVYLAIRYWPHVGKFLLGLLDASTPLIIGAVIAFLVNILMRGLEKIIFPRAKNPKLLTAKRVLCMLLAFVLLLGIIALIIWLIAPQLAKCVELIIAEVPPFVNKAIKWLQETELIPEDILDQLAQINWKENLTKIFSIVTSGIGNVFDFVYKTVASVFSGVVTGVLSLIFAIYLLLGKEKIVNQATRLEKCYLGLSKRRKFNHTLETFKKCFENFIVGQVKEAVILGVLCAIGMWIFRFPYASMIGALIGFTALIPVAGAYIGGIVGFIMIMTESPVKAVLFVVFLLVLQQLEGNLIYPKVVGESIGLPGIWVLAAVTIGGGVMGIPGMLIGVPLVAAIYQLVGEDLDEKLPHQAHAAQVPSQATVEPTPAVKPVKTEKRPKPVKTKKAKKKKK